MGHENFVLIWKETQDSVLHSDELIQEISLANCGHYYFPSTATAYKIVVVPG